MTGTLYVVAEARPLLVPSSTARQVSDALDTADGEPIGGRGGAVGE